MDEAVRNFLNEITSKYLDKHVLSCYVLIILFIQYYNTKLNVIAQEKMPDMQKVWHTRKKNIGMENICGDISQIKISCLGTTSWSVPHSAVGASKLLGKSNILLC